MASRPRASVGPSAWTVVWLRVRPREHRLAFGVNMRLVEGFRVQLWASRPGVHCRNSTRGPSWFS